MMMWHGHWSGVDWVLMSAVMLVFWAAVVAWVRWLVRADRTRQASQRGGISLDKSDGRGALTARAILDSRLASGELSDGDYRARCDALATR